MKKLSEVCKIIGVTRRTLQEYNTIGLLHPSDKTEAGYWLYDENAIRKLMLIQIFVQCGYKRKKIKDILERPSRDLLDEFDTLITTLEEKQKKIDGMINAIKMLQIVYKLPMSILQAMQRVELENIYKEKSFLAGLQEYITGLTEYKEIDVKESELYIKNWYALVSIGCYKDMPLDSSEVVVCINNFVDSVFDICSYIDNHEKVKEDEIIEIMGEFVEEMLSDKDVESSLELQCGTGAKEYIINAINEYAKNKASKLK